MPAARFSAFWLSLLLIHSFGLFILCSWVFIQSRPIPLHDLHFKEGEKLQCVSYAPYHRPGQTPLDPTLHIPPEQLSNDLAQLAKITQCVRLYAVNQGLDQVPPIARQLGLKVLLGAWIGADPKINEKELQHAISIANAYPDVVRGLIVGNEVLLRRERTADEMLALLQQARAQTSVPVTYADVWEFWLRNDQLADAVDFITIHVLPFWEDNPISIDKAQQHIADIHTQIQQHFYPTPILIGETGWPSAGRQRGASLPSRVNQARYIREFVQQAQENGWNYNLIEAIDQPWKRTLEGTVGGYWGLLKASTLEKKFPFFSPVSERDSPFSPLLGALIGALLCFICIPKNQTSFTNLQCIALIIIGAFNGIVTVLHAEHALFAYRSINEWLILGTIAILSTLPPLILTRWQEATLPSIETAWQTLLTQNSAPFANKTTLLLSFLHGWLLFAAAVASLLLFADPRYRDFPFWLYIGPALLFAVIGWKKCQYGRAERICAFVIVVCTLGRWISDPANFQAICWLFIGLALSLPVLGGRLSTSKESRNPTAAPS